MACWPLGSIIPDCLVTQFQVSVTYLIAVSLVLTGALQLGFTRYVADRLFEKHDQRVLPNLSGALFTVTLVSGILAAWRAVPVLSRSKACFTAS